MRFDHEVVTSLSLDRKRNVLVLMLKKVLGLRHGTLPRWLAVAGFPLAAVQLASLLFFPAWLIVLWSLVTSVTLIIRTTRPSIPEPQPAAVLT